MSHAATAASAATAVTGATIASPARASSATGAAALAGAGTTGSTGSTGSTGPWWRHPMMWLVVGGPSLVVVASFVTLTLAVRHADPVVEHCNQAGSAHVSAEEAGTEHAARAHTAALVANGAGATGGKDSPVDDPALQPAMRARNHAATGGKEH